MSSEESWKTRFAVVGMWFKRTVETLAAAARSADLAGRWVPRTAALLLLISGCADDPRRQILDHVNRLTQREITFVDGVKWSQGDRGDCTTFALHNLEALRSRGIPAAAWIVWDDQGRDHAVVISGAQVLDSHYGHIKTRGELEKIGYRFRFPLTDRQVAGLVRSADPGARHG
jgi:hypothetical protein